MIDDIQNILANYISKRYENWLDYSRFHCKKNNLEGEERDVLNEVLENVWGKDHNKLFKLFQQKKKNGTGLDFYVLNIIRVYIKMPTGPYRWKYHTRNINCIQFFANRDYLISDNDDENQSDNENRKEEMALDISTKLIEYLFVKKRKNGN
jgi:hypothetical protein